MVATLATSGYEAVEVVGEPTRTDLSHLHEVVCAAELAVSGLTAETASRPARDLAHPDRDLRRQAIAYYRDCVDLAVRLDAAVIGLHPSAEGRLGPITDSGREWRLAVEATREVAHYAGEHGRSIAVEALNRYEAFLVNRIDQAVAFVDEVDVPSIGIVADFFHMNLEEADLGAALELSRRCLLEVHLADSNRQGLGRGHLQLDSLFSVIGGFNGPFVMEFTAGSTTELDCYLQESAAIFGRMRRDPPPP
jgi:sugar phosphate isomerase/epimerase